MDGSDSELSHIFHQMRLVQHGFDRHFSRHGFCHRVYGWRQQDCDDASKYSVRHTARVAFRAHCAQRCFSPNRKGGTIGRHQRNP